MRPTVCEVCAEGGAAMDAGNKLGIGGPGSLRKSKNLFSQALETFNSEENEFSSSVFYASPQERA